MKFDCGLPAPRKGAFDWRLVRRAVALKLTPFHSISYLVHLPYFAHGHVVCTVGVLTDDKGDHWREAHHATTIDKVITEQRLQTSLLRAADAESAFYMISSSFVLTSLVYL